MKKRFLSIILTLCMIFALVPIMPATVAAESTGYTALAGSGGNPNQGHEKLVDGSVDSKWCVQLSLSPYIIFETPDVVNVSGYDITTADDNASQTGRNPKSWTLYGCNDYSGSTGNWEIIHSVTNDAVLENKNKTTYHYVFDKTETAYKYFKLEITATKGASLMQLSEFVLTDCDHSWNTETKEPTCTEGGCTTTTCTKCGVVKEVSNYTDKLGHNFGEDGICTHCGRSIIFDISQGNVQIFDDENNPGKIKVRYGNGVYLLNIDPETVITVTGTTTQYELKVETDTPVKIKARNLSINSSSRNYSYAFVLIGKNDSADATLILEGTNTFKGGYQKAGITAGEGKKLTIEGDGSVTATGGSQAAGIGGEVNSSCGTIIIKSGTVTANGGSQASGIGGGGVYSQSTGGGGGTVIIIGGTVNATGKNGSADIGGGINNRTGTVIITGGNVNAANNKKTGNAGIKPTDNGALEAYGKFTIPVDLTIPVGKTLTVPESVTMTIPEGVALINDGTINNNGTINNSGTIANNGTINNNGTIANNSTIANNGPIYVNGSFEGTADNLYYPLTVTNATASGETLEYNGKTYAKLGSEITLSCTIPEGQYLVRWDGFSPDVTVENNKFIMPAKALTVTPQIDNIKYTVKFNTVGGGTIADKTNVIWTDKVLDGIENPTKTGYSFVGWKYSNTIVTSATVYGELASADDVTEIELVARWTDNSLFVTKENLMSVFTPNSDGTPESIGKLVFGKNSNKAAQEWYILGKDSGVTGENTIIFAASPLATEQKFASSKNNITLEHDFVYETSITEVFANHYGVSELRKALKAMAVDSSYFTAAEQGLMNATAVTTTDIKNNATYTTRDRLYALQGDYDINNNKKLWAGSNDSTVLAVGSYWNSGEYFWLRSPYNDSGALITYPGEIVNLTSVVNPYAVQPAANLNLTNVLFASAATAASSDAVSAGIIPTGTAMTLRLVGSDKAIGTVIYDTANGVILAEKSTDAAGTVSLVVQGGNGTDTFSYSLPVDGTTAVSAEQIKIACGISDLSLADCEIWLETTIDNVTYAKMAEATDIETMRPVVITGSDTVIDFTGAQIDVSEYFEIDSNAGAATYSIIGGTGIGTLDGSMLTVKKAGTFEIEVNTAATVIYAAGGAVTYLNVNYDLIRDFDFNGDGAANILDLVRLKKIIAGNAESEGASPDLDGSGSYDAADLTILKKFLLGNITVRSEVQLRAALEMLAADPAGGRIALNNDIVIDTEALTIYPKTETQTGEITLDLNGHKLSGTDTSMPDANNLIESFAKTALNIENGTLEFNCTNVANYGVHAAIFKVDGILRLKNCEVNSNGSAAVFGVDSSIELENCSLNGGFDRGDGKMVTVLARGAVMTVKGDVSVKNFFFCQDTDTPWSLTVRAGSTYSFNGESVSVKEDTTYSSDNATNLNWLLNMTVSADS